jgi:hypothetical protein
VSYKKTTGTASLIRHKCKSANQIQQQQQQQQQLTAKTDSLSSLLIPPPLTPAPTFSSSTSSASVSSSTTTKVQSQLVNLIRQSIKSENPNSAAEKSLASAQVQWLSQCLISTDILSEPSYLSFLQSLINYGADFGKQNVANFINRDSVSSDIIPRRCKQLQHELMSVLKDIEFSISYRVWKSIKSENYVTVFGYYFTREFEYKNAILGTRKYAKDNEIIKTVKEVTEYYRSNSSSSQKIKCITDEDNSEFESYPCIISRISMVILTAMNTNEESRNFFKKVYHKAHELLKVQVKSTFELSSDEDKMKIYNELYEFAKDNESHNTALIKKFMHLLGTLFSAFSSLIEVACDGKHCITVNRIYLWYKKFLKFYTEFTHDDKVVSSIAAVILKLIKEHCSDKIHDLYQVAVFLNPNFKSLKFLTADERSVLMDVVKRNLQKLMNEDGGSQPPAKKQKVKNQAHVNDTFLEFMDFTMESIDDQVNSEIQCYMGFKLEDPVDIVEFWKANDCFPFIKKMARNLLNLPSCTFHSNCCFLSADNEFYRKCQNLPADDIENLTFLHQNL